MSHTPGPWYVVPVIEAGRRIFNVFKKEGRFAHIAECKKEEDARLIAAAPQLLEVVAALVHAAEYGPRDPSPLDENSPLMDAARAALTAATGAA